jgi:RNA polymerase sigma-70 factor (ECF subfamily)
MSAPALRWTKESDPELLRGVAEGNLGALGELYDRYARDVWRAVRRSLSGDADDVEDVVHNLFLKLPQIAPSFDGRATCRAWLCGIGVRLAMRHRRGLGRFRRMLGAFALTQGSSTTRDAEHSASNNEELAVLEAALAALSAKKRAVFVLVELEGLSAEEASKALEVPAATVRTRLFHARQELQAALARAQRGEGS